MFLALSLHTPARIRCCRSSLHAFAVADHAMLNPRKVYLNGVWSGLHGWQVQNALENLGWRRRDLPRIWVSQMGVLSLECESYEICTDIGVM